MNMQVKQAVEAPSKQEATDSMPGSEFWKDFAKNIYEKDYYASKGRVIQFPLNTKEVFDLTVLNCQPGAASFEDIRISIGNEEVLPEKFEELQILPKASDGTFEQYEHRINHLVGDKDFTLVIDCYELNDAYRSWAYEFIKRMYAPIDHFTEGHYFTLFYGQYKSTPFGVHDHYGPNECEDGYIFTVKGGKVLYAWTPEYANENPDLQGTFDYEKHIPGATRLEIEEGGMLYFPADRWHVGSSAGYGNVSFPFGIRSCDDVIEKLGITIEDMEGKFSDKIPYFKRKLHSLKLSLYWYFTERKIPIAEREIPKMEYDGSKSMQENANQLPPALIKAGKRYIGLLGRDVVIKASYICWMRTLSSCGLLPAIAFHKKPNLKMSDNIQKLAHHDILYKRFGDKLLIGVGGNVYEIDVPESNAVEAMIDAIMNDDVYTVRDLLKPALATISPGERNHFGEFYFLSVLNQLCGYSVVKNVTNK